MKRQLAALLCLLLFSVGCVSADTIVTEGSSAYFFAAGESFKVANSAPNANVSFTVVNGTLNATGQLFMGNVSGSLSLFGLDAGNVSVATEGNVTVSVDGLPYSGGFAVLAGVSVVVVWSYSAAAVSYSEDDLFLFGVVAAVVVGVLFASFFVYRKRLR